MGVIRGVARDDADVLLNHREMCRNERAVLHILSFVRPALLAASALTTVLAVCTPATVLAEIALTTVLADCRPTALLALSALTTVLADCTPTTLLAPSAPTTVLAD